MKLLIFATHYNDQVYSRSNLISRLTQSFGEIVVCTPDCPVDNNVVEGTRFIQLEGERASSGLRHNFLMLRNVGRLIREEVPDLVLTIGLQPRVFVGLLNRFHNVNAVSIVNGRGRFYEPTEQRIKWIARAIGRKIAGLAYRGYSGFVVQNRDDHKLFSRCTNAKLLTVGGSGVDTSFFTPVSNKNPKYDFLMVARLLRAKGVEDLLEALRYDTEQKLDPSRVCLVLSDIERSTLSEDVFASLQNSGIVIFKAPQNVDQLLSESRFALLPSYQEGCPRFLLEAMSSGVPLIAYNAIGSRDLIPSPDFGWLVPLKSSYDLRSAMNEAASCQQGTYAKMSKTVRTAAKIHYDKDLIEQKIADFLHVVATS